MAYYVTSRHSTVYYGPLQFITDCYILGVTPVLPPYFSMNIELYFICVFSSKMYTSYIQREDRLRGDLRQKRWWTRDWLLRRPIHGQYEAHMAELIVKNPAAFKNFVRIDPHNEN